MAIADVLVAAVVRPVVLGWLDFKDDPVRGWTGPGTLVPSGTGDADLDGDTFGSAEGVVEVTSFSQDRGLGAPVTVSFAAGEMADEQIFEQIVGDRRVFQARKARFWLAFLNAAESAILPEVEPLFTGIMVGAETERQTGKPAMIAVTCDQDVQKAFSAPVRWIDHQTFHPSDTGSSFVNNVARGSTAGAGPRNWKPGQPLPPGVYNNPYIRPPG